MVYVSAYWLIKLLRQTEKSKTIERTLNNTSERWTWANAGRVEARTLFVDGRKCGVESDFDDVRWLTALLLTRPLHHAPLLADVTHIRSTSWRHLQLFTLSVGLADEREGGPRSRVWLVESVATVAFRRSCCRIRSGCFRLRHTCVWRWLTLSWGEQREKAKLTMGILTRRGWFVWGLGVKAFQNYLDQSF